MNDQDTFLSEDEAAYEQAVIQYEKESSLFQRKARRDLKIVLSIGSLIAILPVLICGGLKVKDILDAKTHTSLQEKNEIGAIDSMSDEEFIAFLQNGDLSSFANPEGQKAIADRIQEIQDSLVSKKFDFPTEQKFSPSNILRDMEFRIISDLRQKKDKLFGGE